MKILIVGAGSVGGYFGGRLAQAGRDVTFLVRPLRAQQLARGGLRIISPHGDVVLTPTLVSAEQITAPYDVVFVSVKAYALDAAMHDFAAAVGAQTMILPVLNGMRHVDLLTQRFGAAAVIGGACHVVTELDREGRIVQMADIQQLAYGELDGKTTPRIQLLDATLQGAGFEAHLSPDIMQAMWEKWVQLASLGAVTCLLRGTIGDIAAAPGGTELALEVLAECSAVATACGHKPSATFLSRITALMSTLGSSLTSSMYRDMRKGAPVEADHILGDLLEHGAAHGVATPLLKAAFVSLRIYQATVVDRTRKTP
jgi:2-dehydropantoate 2-reductase